jgi:hypothetical protein
MTWTSRVRTGPAVVLAFAGATAGAIVMAFGPGPARAQTIETARPRTLVVGAPEGARSERADAARTGLARGLLPTSRLHTEWRVSTGTALEQAPLVDARGVTYVIGARGEVIAIARSGAELWRAPTGGVDGGPGVLLSDDTLVFVDGAGTAVAVREGRVRWRSRFGRPGSDGTTPSVPAPATLAAPLPLEDGGVIVATTHELAVLDAEGRERARTTFREPLAGPLVSALGRVVAVDRTGAVFTWLPGSPEPVRIGAFGSPIAFGSALADDHTLAAVLAGGTTFAAIDLREGTLGTRAVAPGGSAGTWLGPPAMRGANATLVLLGSTSELAVTLDPSGREVARALLATHQPAPRLDAGAPALEVPRAKATFVVDVAGTLAFVTLAGDAGAAVASGTGTEAVELLSDVCPRLPSALATGGAPAAAGIAPVGTGSFVVACRSGTVVSVGGDRRTSG